MIINTSIEFARARPGAAVDVPRFDCKDSKLFHRAAVSVKMPRDTPRLRESLPCVESCLTYTTIRHGETVLSFGCDAQRAIKRNSLVVDMSCERPPLQDISSKLPQIVLLKIAPLSEETPVSWGLFVVFVLQGGELDATSEVSYLKHPVFRGMNLSIHHRVEVIKQELSQIPLHSASERVCRLVSALPVREDVVAERTMLRERAEGHEQLGALRSIEVPVPFVCPEEGIEVKGNVWKTLARERLLVQTDRVGEIVALVMKDQGEQVEFGFSSEVAGLIYKDGELLHETSPQDKKSAGGTPGP